MGAVLLHSLGAQALNEEGMQTETRNRSQAMARFAGLSYVAYVALGFYISLGPAGQIFKAGVSAQTDFFFRTGLVAEMALYIFVVLSAAAMYGVLREVDRNLAFLAASCRLIEGAMGACFLLLKYAAFVALTRDDLAGGLTGADRHGLMMLFKHVHSSGLYFLMTVMGVGGAIYFWLFYRTRLIPRWLASWGVFTYGLMIAIGAAVILFPLLKQWVMIAFLPGAAFELLAGLWLLLVGIDMRRLEGEAIPAG